MRVVMSSKILVQNMARNHFRNGNFYLVDDARSGCTFQVDENRWSKSSILKSKLESSEKGSTLKRYVHMLDDLVGKFYSAYLVQIIP